MKLFIPGSVPPALEPRAITQDAKASGNPTIFLIGPRCSGKSTVGGLLAVNLGLAAHDTDLMVVRKAKRSIAEIVAGEGWEEFRALEAEALIEAVAAGGVIAGGGGIVLVPENRRLMRASGLVFYLAASLQTLYERMSQAHNAGFRPALRGTDALSEISAVLAERKALYLECAHHCLDADRPAEEVAREACRLISGGSFTDFRREI
ncbi:MAG: shikimate kinase AroL [Desulfovibrio sp.]|jgi:shikimate kinase|nr:shikimate kinase AroL [Desulfovibrio sp.]